MEYKEFSLGKLRYVIHYPPCFDPSRPNPVLFHLNGAGSRGDNIAYCVDAKSVTLGAEVFPEYPFVTVVPLCSADTWFDLWEHLEELVRFIAAQPYTDRSRIYMTGGSMGGYATWQLAMSMPEYFAAIAPVCGGGMYWNARRIVNIPIWAFHGGKDPTVFPEESKKMVDAVNKRGGNAKLTIYPENGHDAWTDTYSNPELYRWLLSHTNQNPPVLSDDYSSPHLYG
ncbi:MAG: prolyl oligopeptidase family serine peptidase [Clostridia bacterium]|nr:prolyl oligopeptidase family serine peptidase [Clostridia bacterium]